MSQAAIAELLKSARTASQRLGQLSTAHKRKFLETLAKAIVAGQSAILQANAEDLKNSHADGLSKVLLGRLALDKNKILLMAEQIRSVAAQDDLVGSVDYAVELDDGLNLVRRKVPMGVVAMIFESRPDAVTQIFSLCFFSGNAVVLKGGREAEKSITAIVDIIQKTLANAGLPASAVVQLTERSEVNELLKADGLVDIIIPRGGRDLVTFVQENTRIPVLGHADGICHVYVDTEADWDMARQIIVDAKTQAPSTCNAIETILLHTDIAEPILTMLDEDLQSVQLLGDARAKKILPRIAASAEPQWAHEYGDLKLNVGVVDSLENAIAHINQYGSKHTDTIVTEDPMAARDFFQKVDSGSLGWNASTRFADGYRFGLGAEVGISTSKIHARGPVGVEGLLTTKYEFTGQGQRVADYVGSKARKFKHKSIKAPKL